MALTTLESPNESRAANIGRFFYRDAAEVVVSLKEAFAFARDFSLRHTYLLPEGTGVVLQAGQAKDGTLVDLDDPAKAQNITLIFDNRAHQSGRYGWQLTEATTAGRDVYQLQVSAGLYTATHQKFDQQGRHQASCLPTDVGTLAAKVQALAMHERTLAIANELRQSHYRLDQDLSSFTVRAITRLHPDLYDEELTRRQAMIDSLGFTALKPIESETLPIPVINHVLSVEYP